jgi:hypothetical protein
MALWNSAEELGKFNSYLQMGLVIFGILTGLIGASSFIVSQRKDLLTGQEEASLKAKVADISSRTTNINDLPQRHLTVQQQDIIFKASKEFPGTKLLSIRLNSKESQQYAYEIEAVLKRAKWNVDQLLTSSGRNVAEPTIGLREDINSSPAFEALKKSFEEAGLPFKAGTFTGGNAETSLDVGIVPANAYQSLIDKIN